ncbi:MAG: signal peptidase I [Candidatus Aenigmarchaeota archaeon]|nr:signal peptidase I [Candidatus Aenigmarchaeota archaeon]
MKGDTKETVLYMVIGVLMAWGINQGMAVALTTDMPVVAVESNSMVPVFYKGDILVLKGVAPGDLGVGDVIVYSVKTRDVPVVHRIVKINPDGSFQTKGDANSGQLDFEFYIPPENVHGKVIVIIPYLGWVKIGMMQYVLPNVIFVLAAVAVVAAIYYGRRLI